MGQYYTTLVKAKAGNSPMLKIDNESFDSWIGLKLTEHSWLGCVWADLLAYVLEKDVCRVAEVGDYADEYPLYYIAHGNQFSLENVDMDDYIKESDNDFADEEWTPFDYKDKYLVNHDKELYVDFNEYIELSRDSHGDVLSPINLLCAKGNGRGGGDYYEDFPNVDLVGEWAWDLLEITKEAPEEYAKFNIYFKEQIDG